MKAAIKRPLQAQEFRTAELCHITELSNSPDDPDVSIARVRVEPGVTTRWHQLKDTAERYYILSGQGRMDVGELASQNVAAGDTVLIPPRCRQRIANTGTQDLTFLAICSPRFRVEAYEDIEDSQH